MKIKMKHTAYDEGKTIWKKGEIININRKQLKEKEINGYLTVKELDGEKYGAYESSYQVIEL